jgi:uncharacterized membrane protein/gas vesicle protein
MHARGRDALRAAVVDAGCFPTCEIVAGLRAPRRIAGMVLSHAGDGIGAIRGAALVTFDTWQPRTDTMRNEDDRYDYGRYDYADGDEAEASGAGFVAGALTGAVLASALTWLLDPQSGTQRRTLVRDKASSAYQRSRAGIGTASERARGYAQQGRERIRQMRGSSSQGTDSTGYGAGGYGDEGASSTQWLQQAQQMLQGGGQGSRVATGAAGLGLAGWGLSRRGPLGIALGALGLYLVATAARQKSGTSVASGIEVENEVTIDRPIHEVYEFVRRPESWPQFMQHVQDITSTGDRRTHWRVEGPAGVIAEWDAETTEQVPNERICWRTLPGSMVESEGSLELENDGSGGTRVRLRLIYSPPAGAAGHVVAKLFRRDPQTESTHDLQNLKRAIESGQTATAGTSGGSGTGATGSSPLSGSTYSSH